LLATSYGEIKCIYNPVTPLLCGLITVQYFPDGGWPQVQCGCENYVILVVAVSKKQWQTDRMLPYAVTVCSCQTDRIVC